MEQTRDIGGEELHSLMMKDNPYAMTCFHEIEVQNDEGVGFIPCMVMAGNRGYYPMTGDDGQAAWIWGKTHEDCMKACRKYNREVLGLSESEVRDILISAAVATAAWDIRTTGHHQGPYTNHI